jgi:hypothetical protein
MNKLSPLKSIRLKCLDCSNGSASEVRNCAIIHCSLYAFRLGKNPHRQGIGNHAKFAEKSQSEIGSGKQRIDSNSGGGAAK